MQNPRWPSLLYCLKCCSRDPLGKQRGGDGGTKQKYRKVQKNRELEPGTRERAESGRLLYLNQVKVTSSNTTDRACHCLHTTRRYRHKTEIIHGIPLQREREKQNKTESLLLAGVSPVVGGDLVTKPTPSVSISPRCQLLLIQIPSTVYFCVNDTL